MEIQDWVDKYKPFVSPTPTFLEVDGVTYGHTRRMMDNLGKIDLKQIWTIIEVEDEDFHMIIVPGIHAVNVVGFCATEVPWTPEVQFDLEVFV